jgi:hypothetical protein
MNGTTSHTKPDTAGYATLGVMQGEYHWHKHDNDDEFFFVLDGEFLVDLPDRTVTLRPREGFVVPRGSRTPDPSSATRGHPDGGERRNHSNRRLTPWHDTH